MRHYLTGLIATCLAFVGATFAFVGVATAAAAATDTPVPDPSIWDLAKPVLDAVRSGQGWLGAALALVLVVTGARKYGAGRFPWLNSKLGGVVTNVLLSFGGAAATALAAGTAPSLALALTALKVSFGAAAGFEVLKELVAPALEWLKSKTPAKLQWAIAPLTALVMWVVSKKSTAVADAEKAGEAAVKEKPAPGVAGVVGKIRDIE